MESVSATNLVTLRELERINRRIDRRRVLMDAMQMGDDKTVFLSHSAKDRKYIPAVIQILEVHGASVYVDYRDGRIPKTAARDAARILRDSVETCRKFIIFLTPHSKDTKWISWELGVGLGARGPEHVALIPAANYEWDRAWAEKEYLGLYDRITLGPTPGGSESGWVVHNHHDETAMQLHEWLRR